MTLKKPHKSASKSAAFRTAMKAKFEKDVHPPEGKTLKLIGKKVDLPGYGEVTIERIGKHADLSQLAAQIVSSGLLIEHGASESLSLPQRTKHLEHEVAELKRTVAQLSWSGHVNHAEATQYVPLRIVIPGETPSTSTQKEVLKAIYRFSAAMGLSQYVEVLDRSGSWHHVTWLKVKDWLTSKQMKDDIETARTALETNYLNKPAAETSAIYAKAAADLMDSLKDQPNACIQVGNLLLVKVNNVPHVITLSPKQLKRLEENREILNDPSATLKILSESTSVPTLSSGPVDPPPRFHVRERPRIE